MNLAELRSRIQNWEDVHTEFKLQAVHPDDLAAAIVAFANSDGAN
jgi:ATP-dependent DNA helicase RecG